MERSAFQESNYIVCVLFFKVGGMNFYFIFVHICLSAIFHNTILKDRQILPYTFLIALYSIETISKVNKVAVDL